MNNLYDILYEIEESTYDPLCIEIDGIKLNLTDYMSDLIVEAGDPWLENWNVKGNAIDGFTLCKIDVCGFAIKPPHITVNIYKEAA